MKIHNKNFTELTLTELYSILRLRNQIFIVEQECYYEDIDEVDKTAKHIFIKENEEIAAYIRIYKDKEYHIGRVLVRKDMRNKGYSRKLMEYGIDYIFNNLKADLIEIEAQDYLKEFYKSLGFTETSDIYLLDNIPHLQMKLKK